MLCRTRVLYGVYVYRSSFIACYAEPGFYMVFMSIDLVLLHAIQNPGFMVFISIDLVFGVVFFGPLFVCSFVLCDFYKQCHLLRPKTEDNHVQS